jgi:HSP20 family protein
MAENRQLTKRDEQRGLSSTLRSPFSHLFDEAFWDPFRLFDTSPAPSMFGQQQFSLPVDVSETDKEITIESDIPGFDPKNIKIDVRNNMLTISGTQEEKSDKKDKKWHRRERSYSYAEFTRQILLPEYAETSKADCTVKNGMLTITIPKKPEAEAKRLNVRVES